jgi:hypothetical protein
MVEFEVLFEAGRPIMADEIEPSEAEVAFSPEELAAGWERYLQQEAEGIYEALPPKRDDALKVLAMARALLDAEESGEREPAQELSYPV